MAFVDTGATVQGFGGVNPGSPSGGGIQANAQASVRTAPGAMGFGGSLSIKHWVYVFYAVIIGILVITGVIFNGKGRK